MQQKKNNKNKTIKEEVKEENSNKKILLIALILALLIAVAAYLKVAVDNKKTDDKTKNNGDIEEKLDNDVDADDLEPIESDDSSTAYNTSNVIKTNSSKKQEKDDEEDEEVYYSLSFESNGGSSVETQILGKNEVTKYVYSTKEGWVFDGWYEDKELTTEYIFDTHLTEDKTVYAKWIKYVKYMYDNELLDTFFEISLNEEIPLLSCEDLECELPQDMELGWFATYTDEIDSSIISIEILEGDKLTESLASKFDEEIVLNAQFLNKFIMNFNYYVSTQNNPDIARSPMISQQVIRKTVVEGRSIPFDEVEEEIRNEYSEFEDKEFGWYYIESQMKFNLSRDSKASTDITDVYMGEVVTISYYDKEETTEDGNNNQEQLLKEEKVIKNSHLKEEDILKPEEKEGYVFDGWYTDEEESKKLTPDLEIKDDTKFIGKWVDKEEVNQNNEADPSSLNNNQNNQNDENLEESETE